MESCLNPLLDESENRLLVFEDLGNLNMLYLKMERIKILKMESCVEEEHLQIL